MKKKGLILLPLVFLFLFSNLKYKELLYEINTDYAPVIVQTTKNHTLEELNYTVDLKIASEETMPYIQLYALSACLMDAESGRVLYSKDAYSEMPMASTTKIMTLLVALEHGKMDDIVTVTANAAKQPDVQLNINIGEQYYLEDLLYALMLESHNDVAVAIAEHIGGSVETFCMMMTAKAKSIGANNTNFVTPNGLDADEHYTTAVDLALMASYATEDKDFIHITNTQLYQFNELTKGRSFTVRNKNRFLQMMEGAIGVKTGFTNNAGYCFAGAVQLEDKKLVSVVLGSGWPPNKNYKWTDTTRLMQLGVGQFEKQIVFSSINEFMDLKIYNGIEPYISTEITEDIELLLSAYDSTRVVYNISEYITAPIQAGDEIGTAELYINDELYTTLVIKSKTDVSKINFKYCINQLFDWSL